jgi:hypothetical protein
VYSNQTTLTHDAVAVPSSEAGAEAIRARQFMVPMVIGLFSLAAMFAVAAIEGLPIRDPDARYVGSPLALISLIVALFVVLDVIPRALSAARGPSTAGFGESLRAVFDERWWGRRGVIVVICIVGFYATYLSYRNLKSFLPVVTDGVLHDTAMVGIDKAIAFGSQPATVLHDLLGTAVAAPVLSFVYLAFLTFVPLSLGVALVWSSRVAAGLWYVTALTIDWMLGALSYYLVPTLGPVYARPGLFSSLPDTGTSDLQATLMSQRHEVLANPNATDAVQSIAGFASLHVAVILTAALIAHLVGVPRILKASLWIYFGLTCIATIYFGWHYLLDDVAGLGIGLVAVYGAAALTGFKVPPIGGLFSVGKRPAAVAATD